MDFKNAFDSMSHNCLLNKLRTIGIGGATWNWFQAYLTYRSQCVKIGISYSDLCNALSGVPQESVLGPILFVIFINDLPNIIQSAIPFIFADDTKCLQMIRSADDTQKLQSDINNACTWSSISNLPFDESNLSTFVSGQRTQLHTIQFILSMETQLTVYNTTKTLA